MGVLLPQTDFKYVSPCGRIEIYEAASGFYIELRITGEIRPIGDGVDMFLNEDGSSIYPGTPEFYENLKQMADSDYQVNELLQAYFPCYEPHVHYIAMAGLRGCLPEYCEVYADRESAIDGICFVHDIGEYSKFRKNLKRDGYTDLILHPRKSPPHPGHGNQYAEVTECSCDTPWIHSDQSVDDAIEYLKGEWENE